MHTGRWRRELPLHMMLLPAVIIILIFHYVPMAGIVIAFQHFKAITGVFKSKFIGWENFSYVMNMPGFDRVIWNTVSIAFMKIVAGLVVPITISLLLNELRKEFIKRGIQTLIYLPHFMSWVILGGILIELLSPSDGIVNQVLGWFGIEPIYFLGSNTWFKPTLVLSEVWKEFGFSTIVYLAALAGINPNLYEAAVLDGANRWKQTLYITLPGMAPIIILLATLALGNVLNAGFDQVFNLYSPVVYQSGDILDTLTYRMGLVDFQFGPATAVGLFKSSVSLLFISVSYWLASRYANYRIF